MDYLKKKCHYGPSAFSLQLLLNTCRFTWLSSIEATCTVSYFKQMGRAEGEEVGDLFEHLNHTSTLKLMQLLFSIKTQIAALESASLLFCTKPPHVSTEWQIYLFFFFFLQRKPCVLIFLLTTKCSKRRTVEDHHHQTLSTQTCSPTSISSCLALFVAAFKHKQKQIIVSSVHKADDWRWETIIQKWSVSFPTQNKRRDKVLVGFRYTTWKKGW